MIRCAALAAGLLLAVAPAVADTPQRVVSINLCADQYAVLLLPPERIAGLSFLARDHELSYVAHQAADYPSVRANADEILTLRPDLVLAGRFAARSTVALLRRLKVEVYEIEFTNDFAAIEREIGRLAARLGAEAQGRNLTAAMRQRLAALPQPAEPPHAIFFYPNGFSAGSDSLPHEILRVAGYRNAAAEAGLVGYASFGLELLVSAAPDFLVLQSSGAEAASLAQQVVHHPALATLSLRRVEIPSRFLICGGPFSIEAAEILARAQ